MPYELKVDRAADQHLTVNLSFNGQPGAQAELDFIGKNEGKDTLVVTRIHSNHAALRTALAGTSKAKLAYAPDWMLNLTFRPVLQQLAAQIEQGQTASFEGVSPSDAEAQWESNLSAEQREQVSQYQQYEAARPMTDPDADAERYATGNNN